MHLTDSAPEPLGYFVRPNREDSERGPFTVEELKDLAEFGNLTPDFLVRREDEAESQAFHAAPELLASVFPAKKHFRFKERVEADTEASYRPVDVESLYRCESDPEETYFEPPLESVPQPADPEQEGFDPKSVLQANSDLLRATRREPETVHPEYSFFKTAVIVRWLLAMVFLGLTVWIWIMADPITAVVVGNLFLLLAVSFIVKDLINGMFSLFQSRDVPKAVDSTTADACFDAEDWEGAAKGYLAVMKKDPRRMQIYLRGIAAAAAAGNQKHVAAFHASALKHLGLHDRNLLAGALARKRLPPLPRADQ